MRIKYFFNYFKKFGLKQIITVFYAYKIDLVVRYLLNFFFRNRKLKNYIVIESHNDFDNNGGAFFKYLIDNKYNENYKIIWIIKHKQHPELPQNVKAFYSYSPNIVKDYYIVRASYFTFDNDIYETLRDDQLSIYFTHGVFNIKNVHGLVNVPKTVNYVLSPSANVDKIQAKQFSMEFPTDRFLHYGFPAHDVFYENIDESELKKITLKSYNKVILWMPTFRKGKFGRNDSDGEQPFGVPVFKNQEMVNDVNCYLCKNDMLLLIKIHPMQDMKTVKDLHNCTNIIILTNRDMKLKNIDNYRLMRSTDALISDYSSSAFAYLLLDKPIGFIMSDLFDYKPGLITSDPDFFISGPRIMSFQDFQEFIKSVSKNTDTYLTKRSNLKSWMYKYQDGNSSERIADFMGLIKSDKKN